MTAKQKLSDVNISTNLISEKNTAAIPMDPMTKTHRTGKLNVPTDVGLIFTDEHMLNR